MAKIYHAPTHIMVPWITESDDRDDLNMTRRMRWRVGTSVEGTLIRSIKNRYWDATWRKIDIHDLTPIRSPSGYRCFTATITRKVKGKGLRALGETLGIVTITIQDCRTNVRSDVLEGADARGVGAKQP